jgi:hypothetical protein
MSTFLQLQKFTAISIFTFCHPTKKTVDGTLNTSSSHGAVTLFIYRRSHMENKDFYRYFLSFFAKFSLFLFSSHKSMTFPTLS